MPRTRKFSELADRVRARPGGKEGLERARAQLDEERAAHQQGLAAVRRARHLTQVQLASVLDVAQPEVSRIERQADMLLSTLASYVAAMGGELQITARFPDGGSARLDIGDLTGHRPPTDNDAIDAADADAVDAVEEAASTGANARKDAGASTGASTGADAGAVEVTRS